MTTIVTLAETEVTELIAVKVYVAVWLGVTIAGLVPLPTIVLPCFKVTVVALDVFQESVDDCPLVIVAGVAINELITGACGCGFTVTVTEPVTDSPVDEEAVRTYVEVWVGETTTDVPLLAILVEPSFRTILLALVVVQEIVEF